MTLDCPGYAIAIADRGGTTVLGYLTGISRVKWARERDTLSEAEVIIERPTIECQEVLAQIGTNRTELIVYRGAERVWEGPITLIRWVRDQITLTGRDILHHVYRTAMRSGYNNNHPNTTTVVQRVYGILTTELARKEALPPPINVLPYLQTIEGNDGARTARKSLPYESTVFEHMDELAARAGLEYTVVGRSLILFDGSAMLGQTPTMTADDVIGDVIISEYGMEGGTWAAVTDGKGVAGIVGGADGYYGLIELLDSSYSETPEGAPAPDVSVPELRSQAKRNLAGRNPSPLLVRIPDNSTLNPQGVMSMQDLVPGVWVPLRADIPGRSLQQMMRFNSIHWAWTPEKGEQITATLGPRPTAGGGVEIEG